MYDLGEAQAAATLMARLDTPPPGLDADEIVADLNLALGNEATACDMLNAPDRLSGYWAKLRAVCAALQGNTAGAELAIEMALQQDSWLLAAVFATSGELPDAPDADYSSGLNLAISAEAGLTPPEAPVPANRPDLAAAMALHPKLPITLRVQSAGMASQAGMLETDDYQALFLKLISEPGFVPSTPLESALLSLMKIALLRSPQHWKALWTHQPISARSRGYYGRTSNAYRSTLSRQPTLRSSRGLRWPPTITLPPRTGHPPIRWKARAKMAALMPHSCRLW